MGRFRSRFDGSGGLQNIFLWANVLKNFLRLEVAVTARYPELLAELRQAFPQPTSDRFHDAWFVSTILRTLDRVDAMKSHIPLLDEPGRAVDFDSARAARMSDAPRSAEEVTTELLEHLRGMIVWGHPKTQVNVVPPTTIPAILGALLCSIYNPNLVSEESSMGFAAAETRATAMTAALLGYDPDRAGGFFTFGGTATTLYGVRIGLEKALPGTARDGLRAPAVLLASDQAHYCRHSIAAWLGLGERNALSVPTGPDNAMRIDALEQLLREQLSKGTPVAAIVATLGTTDAFGLDDLGAVIDLRDRLVQEYELPYRPHVHADAVIGWAWSVFDDYDMEANPLGFRARTVRALALARRRIRHLHRADSVGVDFHKTGFAPYVSSLFLVRDASDLAHITRDRALMPYLFQTGEVHPGQTTLETSRAGAGPMAALANLLLLGKDGLRTLLGHLVEMAEVLREELEAHAATVVLNGENVGMVTLLRAYPGDVDTFSVKQRELDDPDFGEQVLRHNRFNRRLYELLLEEAYAGQGVLLSYTEAYRSTASGEPLSAIKSFVLTPFATVDDMRGVVERVLAVRRRVEAELELAEAG
jgi:L-2,4-diaminobutyrate decarboxylase